MKGEKKVLLWEDMEPRVVVIVLDVVTVSRREHDVDMGRLEKVISCGLQFFCYSLTR